MAMPEQMETLAERGLVMLGCGKMGSALLEGWLGQGVPVGAVWVMDPNPSDWLLQLAERGLHLNAPLPAQPAAVLIAVKPQMMGQALPALQGFGNSSTLFISIAAGTPIAAFEQALGVDSPIIRAMPNTPAAVSRGITALIGNEKTDPAQMALAESLLGAVGQTLRLQTESQMDAVTAVSGSGPAYVFYLIETMAAAGMAQGLPVEMAMQLAKATVAGAGHLAETADQDPAQLRQNVTSPMGTTAAALEVLMGKQSGLAPLMQATIKAAAERSKELSQ